MTPEKGAKTAKSDKDAKADTAKKKGPGLGKRIAKYFRDVKGEFKKSSGRRCPRWCATRA